MRNLSGGGEFSVDDSHLRRYGELWPLQQVS
jgi:hypothetical protein